MYCELHMNVFYFFLLISSGLINNTKILPTLKFCIHNNAWNVWLSINGMLIATIKHVNSLFKKEC